MNNYKQMYAQLTKALKRPRRTPGVYHAKHLWALRSSLPRWPWKRTMVVPKRVMAMYSLFAAPAVPDVCPRTRSQSSHQKHSTGRSHEGHFRSECLSRLYTKPQDCVSWAIHSKVVRSSACEAWKDWTPHPDSDLQVLPRDLHQSPGKELSP